MRTLNPFQHAGYLLLTFGAVLVALAPLLYSRQSAAEDSRIEGGGALGSAPESGAGGIGGAGAAGTVGVNGGNGDNPSSRCGAHNL